MFSRRLNLFDSMIIVAAIAMGLTSARWWCNQPGYVYPSGLDLQSGCEMIAWMLLPLTPALIAIRLRKPRPGRRRLLRQPGLQANLVICLAITSSMLGVKWDYPPDWRSLPFTVGVDQVTLVGPMLTAGWLLTALAGCRRSEPSMIDRMARMVGWAWIMLWIVRCIFDFNSFVRMLLASATVVVSNA